jgi:hypothetical protein
MFAVFKDGNEDMLMRFNASLGQSLRQCGETNIGRASVKSIDSFSGI